MDGIHGSDSRMHMSDAQHSMHVPYVPENEQHGLDHMSDGNRMEDNNNCGDANVSRHESVEGEVSNPGNVTDDHGAIIEQASGDQLTLSFQGQVYVFDCVSPEK
ncbi:GATA transcription factor 28-like, partial [Neltuma alba]|uniref:GATA transcription factor 28-like n=1 Tax=Neltuma alba TaxID=207710 RepID=UPI0010A4A909